MVGLCDAADEVTLAAEFQDRIVSLADTPENRFKLVQLKLDAGLIEKADEKTDAEINDERRRYYSLSGAGKAAMSAEAERLELLVQLARSKHVLGESKAGFALGR